MPPTMTSLRLPLDDVCLDDMRQGYSARLAAPLARHVQHRSPVAEHPAVRALGKPAADLTVQPVALPLRHRDVPGECVEQPDVLRRGVAGLPAVAPHSHAAEQAGGLDLGGVVGEIERRAKAPAAWQAFADLVVDVLDLTEERIPVGWDHVTR